MSPQQTDSHRCLAGGGCVGATVETADDGSTKRIPALTEKPETMCDACREFVGTVFLQLPQHYRDLQAGVGERLTEPTDKVKATLTPAIPLNPYVEALMESVFDVADRAAAMVADVIKADHPGERSRYPRPRSILVDDEERLPEAGSLALWVLDEYTHPQKARILDACVRMVDPNIDLLASIPKQAAAVYASPKRCELHADPIAVAEAIIRELKDSMDEDDPTPEQREALNEARDQLAESLRPAAVCDDCNGWDPRLGQARRIIEQSGADICIQAMRIHNAIRTHYRIRKSDMRKKMPMPCHSCGNLSLYRQYGEDLIRCDECPPRSEAGRGWTEDQYNRLAGFTKFHLKVREEDEMRELEAANARAEAAERKSAELQEQLELIAKFAGHDTVESLLRVIYKEQPKIGAEQVKSAS